MQKLIGFNIEVHLKGDTEFLTGLLVEVDDGEIYIKEAVDSLNILVIPRSNIKYCITNTVPKVSRTILSETDTQHDNHNALPENLRAQHKSSLNGVGINVFINKQLITSIPVPPTFKLREWHEDIQSIYLRNSDVKIALTNKVQKGIEYFPPHEHNEWAEVHILVYDCNDTLNYPNTEKKENNTFSMSTGGAVANTYLSPSEMIARLERPIKGAKNEQ